jgi:hypothetical protein
MKPPSLPDGPAYAPAGVERRTEDTTLPPMLTMTHARNSASSAETRVEFMTATCLNEIAGHAAGTQPTRSANQVYEA